MQEINPFKHNNDDYTDVVAAVFVDNGAVFAAQRGYGEYKGFWEFPGGKIEKGETQKQALIREIKEELEVDLSDDALEYFDTFYHVYPNLKVALHMYVVEGKPKDFELREHLSYRWVHLENISSLKWLASTYQILDALEEKGILR